MVTLPSRMEDCLARSLSPTSTFRSEHAANRLWIFFRSGVDAGFFAENGAPQRTHVFVGNPLDVFLELVTTNSAAMIFIVV